MTLKKNIIYCFEIIHLLYFNVSGLHPKEEYFVDDNVRYISPATVSIPTILSRAGCVSTCFQDNECVSVNFKNTTGSCEHHGSIPGMSPSAPTPAPGWQVIYPHLTYPPSMQGAVAWQSSTHFSDTADLGIDGNTDSHFFHGSCFHTWSGYSFWAVELPYVAIFTRVTMYYRSESYTSRTRNLRLLVFPTTQSYDDKTGTQCAYYGGPPNRGLDNPLKLPCSPGTFGKILKIKQETNSYLHLCEVIVN